jgi:hypothetical protein
MFFDELLYIDKLNYRAPLSQLQVSILGPFGYEPNTLPLRQVAIFRAPQFLSGIEPDSRQSGHHRLNSGKYQQ